MKKVKNIKELDAEFGIIQSVVSGDTRFIAEAMYFLCNRFDSIYSYEKRLKMLLNDIESVYGTETNPRELFEKRFPELRQ